MDTAAVVDLGRYALWMTALISAPLLGTALGVGLIIGILQAATSINEMTLSFIPKLVALGWWNLPGLFFSVFQRCFCSRQQPQLL
jgi:flagellar biosynthesis protein FliQ